MVQREHIYPGLRVISKISDYPTKKPVKGTVTRVKFSDEGTLGTMITRPMYYPIRNMRMSSI